MILAEETLICVLGTWVGDAFASCNMRSLLLLGRSKVGTRFLGVPDWSSLTQEAHAKDIYVYLVEKEELYIYIYIYIFG